MTFPVVPRDVVAEMFLLGGWTDITSDVQLASDVRIVRGRANEAGQPAPSTCTLQLNNRTGKYSPRNPAGPYYGSLGRNTPLRFAVRVAKDSCTRTVSNSWGTADVGGAWTLLGTASQFAVNGTAATMTHPTATSSLMAYQAAQIYGDVDVSCSVTIPFTTVTGASIEPIDLCLSGLSTSDFFESRLLITTGGAVTLDITHIDGTSVVAPVTITSFTWSGQQLRVRFQQDGQTLRAKVWPAGSAEPYTWQCEGHTDRLYGRAHGWVGVRSGVPAGNTNVPLTYSLDNFEVRCNRFAGDVSNFPPQWDVSGRNVFTQAEAAGIRRRLGQGQIPLKSTYLRGNQTISPAPVAYWPVEDGSTATSIASGIGGSPMSIDGGTSQLASNSAFACSAPMGVPGTARWVGQLGSLPATGSVQVMYLLAVPSSGDTDQGVFVQVRTTGSVSVVDSYYDAASGNLFCKVYDNFGTFLGTAFGAIPVKGRPLVVSIELLQIGSDVQVKLATFQPGASFALVSSQTFTNKTVGAAAIVFANPNYQSISSGIGHISVRTDIVGVATLKSQVAAYAGETANARMIRLCAENNIPFTYSWNGVTPSAQLGAQGRATVLDLIDDAAAANSASVYDNRNVAGFVHRDRTSLYNQPAALALDYSVGGHVAPPFRPVEDDQAIRNDITLTRTNGSSVQATQTTGRLAATDPSTGAGVGRYADAVTLNLNVDDQLPNAAGWLLHLGTVDEPRYPTIAVKLAKLATVSPQLALDALAVNLDDRITVANPPAAISPGTISQLARGYTETINAFRHDIVFQCAPASPYEVAVADDAARGKADSGGSYLAAAATSSATTLWVGTLVPHPVWTTDPAQCPILVTVAGEAMTATAITSEGLSNTGFESGLSPWVATNATVTQSGVQKNSGSFAARLVPNGSSTQDTLASEQIPVIAGQLVTVSMWVWFTNAVTNNIAPAVTWYNAVGGVISTSSTVHSASATTWTQLADSYTAPAGAVTCQLVATLTGTPAAGQVWYVDDASVQAAQKFTVTRSVNGVVKAQASGGQVQLTRPSIAAL